MPQAKQHPYTPFLSRLQKPSQYVGGEHGQALKDWNAVEGRMCLAFPDLYEVGMSHLGYKILYSIFNKHPRLLAERAYAPFFDLETELRKGGERLRSIESWRPLCDFDVVGFSLQFELTYTTVLAMLDLGGIPLRAEQRSDDDPLVIAGGPVATHGEPLAPFMDAFVIGDGEALAPEVVLLWTRLKKEAIPRAERLRQLARLEGVYVPALYTTKVDGETGFLVVDAPLVPEASLPVRRAFVADINQYPFPSDGPVATTQTVFDRVAVEIARGCTEGCRFCQAGMIYRPVRERAPDSILQTIEDAVDKGGFDEASLTSLSTADYSAVAPLVRRVTDELGKRRVALSVSSLRAYGLSEDVLDDMKKQRATGLTFAPEAGTQRMRDVVNKNVTEEQLLETAHRVFSRGWSRMKLYFMIGLPTEEDRDVVGIVETGRRAVEVGRQIQGKKRGGPQVTVSVSTFVPKPHTPFQWCAMDGQSTVERKQQILRDTARGVPVKLKVHPSDGSWLEGVLARGDRRLADVIEHAYRNGARFDSWQEHIKLDVWQNAFESIGIDPTPFLGTIPVTARLPWDHFHVGLEDGFLAREYRRAVKNKLSPPCGKAIKMFVHHTNVRDAQSDARKLVCYNCGVACDMKAMATERVTFLRSLAAEEPRVRTERPTVTAPEDRKPFFALEQGPAVRVRIGYTKLGRLSFHGHLDLVRLWPRLCRRLGLPLFHSQGFHPKPQMTFSPALGLGVSSLTEYVDIKLRARDTKDLSTLATDLNAIAPEGMFVFGTRVLGPSDPSLSRIIDRAGYVGAVPAAWVESVDALRHRVLERFQGSMQVVRHSTRADKDIDVAKYLLEVDVGAGAEALERAGIVGDLLPISLKLWVTPTGTARPAEALAAATGFDRTLVQWVRTSLTAVRGDRELDPMTIDAPPASARIPTEGVPALAS